MNLIRQPVSPGIPSLTLRAVSQAIRSVSEGTIAGRWALDHGNARYSDWVLQEWHKERDRLPDIQVWTSRQSAAVLVVSSGLTRRSLWVNQILGHGRLEGVLGGGYTDQYTLEVALEMQAAARRYRSAETPRCTFAGHSQGARAASIAAILAGTMSGLRCGVVSLGAPKVGDWTLAKRIADNVDMVRVVMDGDFVTAVPSLGSAWAQLLLTVLNGGRDIMLDWYHPVSAYKVSPFRWSWRNDTGVDTADGGPAPEAVLYLWTDADWYAWHSAARYDAAFQSVLPRSVDWEAVDRDGPQLPGVRMAEGNFMLQLVPQHRVVQRREAAVMFGKAVMAMADAIGLVIIPKVNRWYPSFDGLNWWAAWEGFQLVLCPTKSHAKTLCKKFNGCLRYMQRMDGLSVTEFSASAASYATASTDPAGGFKPVLGSF